MYTRYNTKMTSINNRQFTRFSFSAGMWVKVIRPFDSNEFKVYQLIDISQGGIALRCHNATEFKRGDQIFITQIEDQILDRPISCKVMYVKVDDEFNVDFRVGIEFIEKI